MNNKHYEKVKKLTSLCTFMKTEDIIPLIEFIEDNFQRCDLWEECIDKSCDHYEIHKRTKDCEYPCDIISKESSCKVVIT